MKLEIEKVIYGGQGLARIPQGNGENSGMRAFVPFTLPGEVAEASIASRHRGYCEAAVQRIEQASPLRVLPECPWFGECGGCQLQHASYALQVEMKRAMLSESLTRAGMRDLPGISAVTGDPFAYRNRVRLRVEAGAFGYRQGKSHRLVPVDHCPIAMPLLQECIGRLQSMARNRTIPPEISEVELFTNHDQSALLITFAIERAVQPVSLESTFFSALREQVPALTGAAAISAAALHPLRPLAEWGGRAMQYVAAGRAYTVSIGSFFQVNATLLDAFVPAVIGDERGSTAWDLYAGVGLFSAALAEQFRRVVAVESAPSSARDLRANLRRYCADIHHSTTLEFLETTARETREARPDLAILDPPRAGVGVRVCRLLAKCAPARILYVSCDPATLGRDLAALIQSGYRLDRLQLVDMFPQTGHVESIAALTRR